MKNKKKGCFQSILYIKSIKLKNYLLGWIENFGVVPLLRSSAFLLLPILVFLFARLVFVTRVLETIFNPLSLSFYKLYHEKQFVPILAYSVKIFVILPLLLVSIHTLRAEDAMRNPPIILSIGEIKDIPIAPDAHFSVGNTEVIGHKYRSEKKVLMIKGKKIGFTEILVWPKDDKNNPERIQIYVMSKQQQMKLVQLWQAVQKIGLNADINGTVIIVHGEITNFIQYQEFIRLQKEHTEKLQFLGHLNFKLRNDIIGEIYELFYKEFIDDITCRERNGKILCEYPSKTPPSQNIQNYLNKKFLIEYIPLDNRHEHSNYIVKLKLIQIEKLNGEELSFGLDKIEGSLGELFENGVTSMLKKNRILLNNSDVDISTLAEPQGVVQEGEPALFQVGAEIPFLAPATEKFTTTEWKFAGLKIKLDLKRKGSKFIINYQTEFTRPEENNSSISGNKEKSSATIEINQPLTLFQIGFKTVGENISSFPILSKIPILGEIFKSKSKRSNYKKITGIILIEKN